MSYHLHHNICKIKLPNITSKCQRQHRASENILRVKDYYGFQMSSRRAMSSRCHGAEWPNFSLEHKARSLEASSNIRRNHSTHRPSFFGGLDSLQILGIWQNLTHLDFAKSVKDFSILYAQVRLQHVYWNSEFKLEPGTQVCNDVYNNENLNPHCDGKIHHAMLTSSSTKHQVNMSLGGSTCDSRAP